MELIRLLLLYHILVVLLLTSPAFAMPFLTTVRLILILHLLPSGALLIVVLKKLID
jgi:hypothetical protein